MPANPLLDEYDQEIDLEPGILGRLGRTSLSGISAVGSLLDVPGAAVRSVLAGEAPASLLPWNWMDQDGRISGRGLLRKYGLISDTDSYSNFWGGMAAEVVLDPMLYVGLGALTKGAQVGTQAASTGAKGLLRASIPGTRLGVELGTGARAEQIAKGLGSVGSMLTKPSKLAPALEKAAKYWPGAKAATSSADDLLEAAKSSVDMSGPNVKPFSAADEAVERIDQPVYGEGAKFYEAGKPIGGFEMWRTYSTNTIRNEIETMLDRVDKMDIVNDPSYNDVMASIHEAEKELARRAGGAEPISWETLIKPGKLHQTTIPVKNINDIESVVPKNIEPPVAEWAKKAAEIATFPGRAALGLFHAPVRGKFTEDAQSLARAQWEKIGKAQQQALEEATAFVDDYHEIEKGIAEVYGADITAKLPKELAGSAANLAKSVRDTTERLFGMAAETSDVEGTVKFFDLDPSKANAELLGRIGDLGWRMKETNRKIYQAYLDMGGKGEVLPRLDQDAVPELAEIGNFPGFEHFPRFGAEHPDNVLAALSSGGTRPGSSMARLEPLRAVPREVIERIGKMVQGMKAEGLDEGQWAKSIEAKFGNWLNKEKITQVVDGAEVEVEKWGSAKAHAQSLAKWAGTADNYATYLNDNLKAESRYLRGLFTATANMGGIYDVVKSTIGRRPLTEAVEGLARGTTQLRGLLDTTKPLDGIPVVTIAQTFKDAGMDVEKSLRYLAKELGDSSDEAVAQLRDHGAIPEAVSQAIIGSRKVQQHPEWAQTLARVTDIPTRWFKENVTLPFASFAARNLASGQFLNAASGVLENLDDLKLYTSKVGEAFELWRKGEIPKELEREWFVKGVLGQDMMFEGIEKRGGKFAQAAPDSISPRRAWQEAGEQIEPSFLDRIPGLRTARQVHGAVLGTGSHVNHVVEFLNRVPLYETLKAKGWSADAAAAKVAELQVDYSHQAFSPFENDFMRRLMPFYSWQRRIGPVILGSLARHPSGPMGQTIRASRLASSDDPRMPEWMGDTLAMENPLGSSEPGGQSYITGLGLPHEATLGYFGGGLRGFGREALSQLNPLIKAPLEWSTGTSFFQSGPGGGGRALDEMNPPIGQTLANVARIVGRDPSTPVPTPALAEFAVANSPLSRYVTTARQITDPRKHPLSTAANLLTGVRVTDVSPQAQDSILRGRANELIRQMGGRTLKRSYFPDADKMPQADQEVAQGLKELLAELDRRGRQRREAGM